MQSWSGSERLRQLRRLWAEHRALPYPALPEGDPNAQELSFYASWVGSLVEAALASSGRLDPNRLLMLEVRRREGNQAIWAASGALGGAARALVARLLQMEELLTEL